MNRKRNFNLHGGKTGAAITVRVSPRMAKNEISEILNDGTIKIRLTAPPVDGKANQALIEFLADLLSVKPANIEIVAGQTGRDKLITVIGLSADEVHAKIMASIS